MVCVSSPSDVLPCCRLVGVKEGKRLPMRNCVAVDCPIPYPMLEKELKIVHNCILQCENDTEYPAVQ